MRPSKVRAVTSWVLVVLFAAAFIMSSLGKLTGTATGMFANWGYPAWFATLIGILELAGAVGLLIPKTTRFAVFGLTVIMLGAAFTHLSNNEGVQVVRPLIFMVALWVVWWLRRVPPNGSTTDSQ